jgi:hypothetical protein
MGKFIGGIIGAVMVGASFAFGGPFGAAASKLAVGLFLGGASSILGFAANTLFGPKAPKPQQSESQTKSPTAPRVYCYGRRRVYGNVVFWGSATSGASVDVIAFLDGQSHAMVQAYLNDEPVTISGGNVTSPDGKAYAGNIVQAGFRLGAATETAHAAVISALPSVWTSAHRGDGVTSGYLIKQPVKEKRYLERYPQGDNVVLSAVFDAQLCYDPRTDTTVWTDNPVLHMLHYLTEREGYDYATRILPQIALWEAAADICDETISSEKRYRSWILCDSTAKPHEVKASILETFDGWMAENEAGEVLIYAGKYTAPTVTINAAHIVEYEHQSYVNDEDYFNEISVKYISADHDYNEVEAQPWRDESDITARGYVNSTSIAPQVPSHKQARRLAKITQARNNAADRGTVTTNYGGRIVEGQRFINLEIIEAGVTIFDGVAEIIAITRNLETSGYTFQWVKADPNAWTWNTATEDGYGAPTGTFPTIAPPEPPEITAINYAFDAAAQTASLAIEGTGPARSDLTWYARTRRDGDTAWVEREYADIDGTASVELIVDVAPIDTPIEVQISYITGSGAISGWSATETVTVDDVENRKDVIFVGESAPSSPKIGDLWSRESTGYLWRWSGSAWVAVANLGATPEQVVSIATALTDAANAQATADGKIDSFYQASAPSTASEGDIWFDTDDGNKQYRRTGSSWVVVRDEGVGLAITAAAGAQETADGKVTTFVGESAPSAEASGDLWFNASTGELRRWSGSAWGDPLVDLTAVAVPYLEPSSRTINVNANYLGVVDSAALPIGFTVARYRGDTNVSATTTWSIVDKSPSDGGTVAVNSTGAVSITAITKSFTFKVRAARDGVTLDALISVVRVDAAPPAPGSGSGSSGTTVFDTSFSPFSGSTAIAVSDLMTVKTGASGQIAFAADLEISTGASSPSGAWNAALQWRYRTIGGSWTNLSEAGAVSLVSCYYDADALGYIVEPGQVTSSPTVTGLSANTDYEVQLLARRSSGTTRTLILSGNAVATGS